METKADNEGCPDAPGGEAPAAASRQTRRFFQFALRELLLLFALVAVLLGLVAPKIHAIFQSRRVQETARRQAAAEADLDAAVRANDVALARKALETAPLELGLFDSPKGSSLLFTCISNGQIEIMELLLNYGADADRFEQSAAAPLGRRPFRGPIPPATPLFAAADCDQPFNVRRKMIQILVTGGANPKRPLSGHNMMDVAFEASDAPLGDLLREYGLPYGVREMAAFNRLNELKVEVEKDPQLLQRRFRDSYAGASPTLLGIALRRGYREMSLFLIEAGAPLDVLEHEGYTLLHQAALGGDPQLMRLLVERGLDVNATDRYSDTPLRDIAGRDNPRAVAALLELGADVDQQGINGYTPLHSAIQSGNVEIVRLLLAAGADMTFRDVNGQTPLDLALVKNPTIADLLEQAAQGKRSPNHD